MTHRRLLLLAVSLATALFAAPAWADPPYVGSEFQVNTYTTGYQYVPSVASAGEGTFVVVWQSYPQIAGKASDIFGQRFDADGAKVGGEFQVNTTTAGYQYFPHAAMAPGGAFTVVWTNGNGDGDGSSISAQRFTASGTKTGGEFQVNKTTGGYQTDPRAAIDANGNMTVVWWTIPSDATPNPDGDGAGVFARRFSATGTAVGNDFQVNTITTGDQSTPDLDYDSDGNLVVVWQTTHSTNAEIAVRRFSAAGAALGSDFVISNAMKDSYPHVSAASDGSFVVVWDNGGSVYGLDGSSLGVFAQRFNADGTTAAPVFQVNSYTTDAQAYPSVATGSDGNFIVTWESDGQVSPFTDIIAQRYRSTGAPFETELKVDTFDGQRQSLADIASIGGDRFAVVWESWSQDGDAFGIFGQIIEGGFATTTTTTTTTLPTPTTTTLPVTTTTLPASTTTTLPASTTTTLPVPTTTLPVATTTTLPVSTTTTLPVATTTTLPIGPPTTLPTPTTTLSPATTTTLPESITTTTVLPAPTTTIPETTTTVPAGTTTTLPGSTTTLPRSVTTTLPSSTTTLPEFTTTTTVLPAPTTTMPETTTTVPGGTTTTLPGSTTTLPRGVTTTLPGSTTTLPESTTTTIPSATTTTLDVTTTTLAVSECGDPAAPKVTITATDSLMVLRAAVKIGQCDLCVCDVNSSSTITAADALVTLRHAIALPSVLNCPPCQ